MLVLLKAGAALSLLLMISIQFVYAGGPRYDSPEDSTLEGGQCWVDGYDAGFAGKYDQDRADECLEKAGDEYNWSWKSGCKDAGYMPDECADFKNNPVNLNHATLEEENRRTCYDDGYEDGEKGQAGSFDKERNFRCGEFGSTYENGFMAGCQIKDSRDVCKTVVEVERSF
jgi:hypothetical protein